MTEVSFTLCLSGPSMSASAEPVDFIEELRLRRLAHEQYLAPDDREGLHPITLDELSRMDADGITPIVHPDDDTVLTDDPANAETTLFGSRIVPLMPDLPGWHGPHEIVPPHVNISTPAESTELHYT